MTRSITLLWALCGLFINSSTGQYHCLNFNGVSDMLELNATVGNNVRSIQLWFRPGKDYDETNELPATILYRDAVNQVGEFGLYIGPKDWAGQEGKLVFARNVGTQRYLITSNASSWKADQWYHVIAYIDPSGGMQMFIDGVFQNDIDNTTAPTDTRVEKVMLGAWGVRGFRSFEGQIDDVTLMDRMMTPVERNRYLQRDASGVWVYSGTTLHLPFNEGQGSMTQDLMSQTDFGIDSSQWVPTGAALRIDQDLKSIDLGDRVGDQLRSIEMWFRPESQIDMNLSEPAGLIYRETGSGSNEMGLYFGPMNWSGQEGRLVFSLSDENRNIHRIVSDNDRWDQTKWYHVAAVIDPDKGMRMYIDGQLQLDTNTYTQATGSEEFSTVIGKWGFRDIRYYQGLVDEVRIWQRALSEDEVLNYECANAIDSTSLGAYYVFDHLNDSILYDNSGFENHIDIGRMDKWEESRTCSGTADFEMTTSIPQTLSLHYRKLSIQPNPVTTDTRILFPDHKYREWQLLLYNGMGQLLGQQSGSGSVITLTRNGLSSGLYYVRVIDQSTQEEFIEKLIMN